MTGDDDTEMIPDDETEEALAEILKRAQVTLDFMPKAHPAIAETKRRFLAIVPPKPHLENIVKSELLKTIDKSKKSLLEIYEEIMLITTASSYSDLCQKAEQKLIFPLLLISIIAAIEQNASLDQETEVQLKDFSNESPEKVQAYDEVKQSFFQSFQAELIRIKSKYDNPEKITKLECKAALAELLEFLRS